LMDIKSDIHPTLLAVRGFSRESLLLRTSRLFYCPSTFLRLSGAMPSPLTTCEAAASRLVFFGRLAVGLAAGLAFLSRAFFLSSFFFLVPAALPEALRFFGPM